MVNKVVHSVSDTWRVVSVVTKCIASGTLGERRPPPRRNLIHNLMVFPCLIIHLWLKSRSVFQRD